jgi:hypothetical protein
VAAAKADAEAWVQAAARVLKKRRKLRRRALAVLPRWALSGSLKFLDLSFADVTDAGCGPVGACLAHQGGDLRLLNLSGNNVGAQGCAYLAGGLLANASLRKLLLSGNAGIGDEGVKHLAEGLRHHPTVKELRLDSCNVGLGGAFVLAGRVVRHNASLEKLGLASNHIGSDGFTLLQTAAAAAATGMLVQLDCQFNGINEFMSPGWRVLARRLGLQGAPHCSLKTLNLSGNMLNDSGLGSLASVLPLFPHLESLNVGNNLLGIRGVYPLMRAIPFTDIKDLDLSGNPLDAPSTWALAYTLSHDSALENVNLEGTSLGGRSAAAGHLAVAVLANAKSSLKTIKGPKLASALQGFGITTKWEGVAGKLADGSCGCGVDDEGGQSQQGGGAGDGGGGGVARPAAELSNIEVLAWIRDLRKAAAEHELAVQDYNEELELTPPPAPKVQRSKSEGGRRDSTSGDGGGGGGSARIGSPDSGNSSGSSGSGVTRFRSSSSGDSMHAPSRRKKASVLPPPPDPHHLHHHHHHHQQQQQNTSTTSAENVFSPTKRPHRTATHSDSNHAVEVSLDGAFDLDSAPAGAAAVAQARKVQKSNGNTTGGGGSGGGGGGGDGRGWDNMMNYDAIFDPAAYLAANPDIIIEDPDEEPPFIPPSSPPNQGGQEGFWPSDIADAKLSVMKDASASGDDEEEEDSEEDLSLLPSVPAPIRPLVLSGVPAQLSHFLADTAAPPGTLAAAAAATAASAAAAAKAVAVRSTSSSSSEGSVAEHGGATATSMLELQKFIAFDEEEFRTFIGLFRLETSGGSARAKGKVRRTGIVW